MTVFEVISHTRNANNIHMYVHNWSLQLFNQDNDLASHTTYFVY